MKHSLFRCTLAMIFLLVLGITGCQAKTKPASFEWVKTVSQEKPINIYNHNLEKYSGVKPLQWGEKVSGVAYKLDTDEKVLALTFDACGGSTLSNGYDASLIEYLEKMHIPATLFITGKWIDANPEIFKKLAHNDLFEIENHGLNHMPCSVTGKKAYGIKGTSSVAEVVKEIAANGDKIKSLSGRDPHYYRSGTNYYDEVAVAIAHDLGYTTVGYSVLGDAGATYSRDQVKKALLSARAGSIIICHFNHPEGDTAEGIMEALPILQKNGFRFVRLADFPLKFYP